MDINTLRPEAFQRNEFSNRAGRTPREILIRTELPYGLWTLRNGYVFLFNRCYENLIGKNSNGELITYHPDFWHGQENPIIKHQYFYNDSISPTRNKNTLELIMQIKYDFLRTDGIPSIINEATIFVIDERLERTK